MRNSRSTTHGDPVIRKATISKSQLRCAAYSGSLTEPFHFDGSSTRIFQMKNAKRNSHKKEDRAMEELRASALRALSKTALKDVKGGDGSSGIYPSDPIC